MDEQRQAMIDFMAQITTTLGQIAEQYMGQLGNEMALKILHQIVKIFYVANQLILCPFMRENNAL